MPLETGSFINDLTPTNPPGSDPAGQGDDHIRLIKATVQGTFPQMGAVFGQVRRQDTALSISSTWNTNHFIASASATATVVLTLPAATSITAGFYVDITTIGTGTVNLATAAGSINGGTSLSIPALNTARAYFLGGTAWLADVVPHGQGGAYNIGGTLSVSGAVTLGSTLSVSGATALAALTVNGVATLSAAVHMKSTLSVSGATVLAALTVGGALTVAGTATISGTLVLTRGQIAFPAVQVPNAGANVLDDYEEGTWAPILTFDTPGDISVTYSIRDGTYTKIGDVVHVSCRVLTSAFTWTTASGQFRIAGFPFASGIGGGGIVTPGALSRASGVLVPGFTVVHGEVVGGDAHAGLVVLNVPTGASAAVGQGSVATGNTIDLVYQVTYKVN